MDYIQHIPVEKWDLKEQDLQLENALKNIELSKIALYQALNRYRYWQDFSKDYPSLNCSGLKIDVKEYKDKVKIMLPGIIPYVNLGQRLEDKDYYKKLDSFYQSELTKAIVNAKVELKFNKAFVVINQFFPDLIIRDFDNQIKSFIFNALRYSKLIQDDSWRNITYLENGELDRGNPRTEIIVVDDTVICSLLSKI